MDGLTEKQKRFVEEFLKDLNATQAYIRAGYSENGANVNSARLMANDSIQAEIQKAQAERQQRSRLTADEIIHELEKLALPDIQGLYDDNGRLKRIKDMTPDQARLINELSMTEHGPKVKLYDRLKALDMLMRHHGLYEKPAEKQNEDEGAGLVVVPADSDDWKDLADEGDES